MDLSSSEESMIVAYVILTQCHRVKDRLTDGRIYYGWYSALHSKLWWRAVKIISVAIAYSLLHIFTSNLAHRVSLMTLKETYRQIWLARKFKIVVAAILKFTLKVITQSPLQIFAQDFTLRLSVWFWKKIYNQTADTTTILKFTLMAVTLIIIAHISTKICTGIQNHAPYICHQIWLATISKVVHVEIHNEV